MKSGISRRAFMKGAAAGTLGLAAASLFGGVPAAGAEAASTQPVQTELPIPEPQRPETTEYTCDVLVVGGGFAGLFAALEAKAAGTDVLLMDKGRPGYSGLSAWASSHCYFDAELGDSAENFEYAMKYANEWVCNLDWVKAWIRESKSVYEKCVELAYSTSTGPARRRASGSTAPSRMTGSSIATSPIWRRTAARCS